MSLRHIITRAAIAACVTFSLLPLAVYAQPDTLWVRSYIPGGSPLMVIKTFDGGFAIGTADWQGDENRRDSDYLLILTDSVGVMESQMFYALDPDTLHQSERCFAIVQLPDSSYVLAGSGPGYPGSMIVRIHPGGEMIFSRFYPHQQFADFTDCVVSTDGNLVVTAYGGAAKLNSDNGDIIWRIGYGFEGSGEVRQVINTDDGGYLLTGKIASIGAGGNDMYAVKIDADGEVEWRNAYGTDRGENTFDAIQTADGGYCIAGFSYREGRFNAGFLVRTDSQGEEIWRNLFVDEDDNYVFGSVKAITETPDGGFALIRDGGNYSASMGRVSHDGELMWTAEYRIGGDSTNRAYSILLMTDYGYVLGGFTGQIGDWLVRTEPDSLSVLAWDLQSVADSLAFEGVPLDSTGMIELTLTNEAEYPVWIHDIFIDSSAFTIEFEDNFALEAGEEVAIPVTFSPTDSSDYVGVLTVHTKFGDVVVNLSGTGTVLSVSEEIDFPHEFDLSVAFPNPFNSTVRLGFSLPEDAEIKLTIFDISGRQVASLFDGTKEAGKYTALWNAKGFAAGSYMLRLSSDTEARTQQLTLIK